MLKDDIIEIMEKYEHKHGSYEYGGSYSLDSGEYGDVADEIVELVLKKIMVIRKEER